VKTKNLLIFFVFILVIMFGLFVWPGIYRYDKTRKDILIRTNRFTGQTEMLRYDEWEPVESKSRDDNRVIIEIPQEELSKINGKGGVDYRGQFSGTIYNGSQWTITEITFALAPKEINEEKKTQDVQFYKSSSFGINEKTNCIPPLSAEKFSFLITENENGKEFSWAIYGAKGYRE
jgi:hypothetical protein